MQTIPIPQDAQMEFTLLARMLKSINALNEAMYELKGSDFFDPRHQAIFSSMKIIYSMDCKLELETLLPVLKDNFPLHADMGYLQTLNFYGSSDESEFKFFIKEIKRFSMLRQILHISQECNSKVTKNSDPLAIQFEVLQNFENIMNNTQDSNIKTLHEIGSENFSESNLDFLKFVESQMEKYALGISTLRGLPTGFQRLDNSICGLCPGHFIVIAARPGVGKTTFALNMMRNIASRKIPIGFFSLEMTSEEAYQKLAAIASGIPANSIRDGTFSPSLFQDLVSAYHEIAELPIFIDDQSSLPVSQLIARTKRMIDANAIKVLFIDYLGEVKGEGKFGTKQEEVASVSKALRHLAKSCQIPIVCIAQLNRQNETENRAPRKSDLRESGQIEADAHSILLLYRAGQDNIKSPKDLCDVIIAKNRFGSEGKIVFDFKVASGLFTENQVTFKHDYNNES